LFIRHAFGLQHSPKIDGGVRIRIYPDRIPNTAEQVAIFKTYLCNLSRRPDFRRLGLTIALEDVAEVISHEHDILQCLDVVLGSMNFRLNDRYLDRPDGASRRTKKTLARCRLYRRINQRIREIYPNFNVGISTGHQGDRSTRWGHPYRHWCFRSKNAETVGVGKKKGKEKSGTP
jgi:hypothetical protein